MTKDVLSTGSALDREIEMWVILCTWHLAEHMCVHAWKFKCFCDPPGSFLISKSATLGYRVGNGGKASLGDLPNTPTEDIVTLQCVRVILDSHTTCPLGGSSPGEPRGTPELFGWRSASVQPLEEHWSPHETHYFLSHVEQSLST